MKKIILGCCIMFSILSCKEQKPAAAPAPVKVTTKVDKKNSGTVLTSTNAIEAVDSTKESGAELKLQPAAADTTMRFIASFYSIGEGVDRGMPEKLKTFTEQYGQKTNQKINYNETHWGREGETDYCFPLKELTNEQQLSFIKQAKEVLAAAKHVYFFENKACRKGR